MLCVDSLEIFKKIDESTNQSSVRLSYKLDAVLADYFQWAETCVNGVMVVWVERFVVI